MAKKRKSTPTNGKSAVAKKPNEDQHEQNAQIEEDDTKLPPGAKFDSDDDDDYDDDSSSSDDDSLVLEGVVVRNPDASDSEDEDDDDDVEETISSEEEDEDEEPEPSKKKAKSSNPASESSTGNKTSSQKLTQQNKKTKKTKKKKSPNEPEIIQVEFLFCDMNERFFHGMKTLLHRHSIHAPHSSQLTDLILENVSVGTVLSTDDPNDTKSPPPPPSSSTKKSKSTPLPPQEEPNVFGFATVINLTTHHSTPCIQSLKSLCLSKCPPQHKPEMETVLSGKTKRPAGFFFQERMVNVPLEIVEVMHQQLVLDMDWAVENAEGGEEERKSLDFGAFVRLAPCSGSGGGGAGVIYKYFEDEVFATNAEFVYAFEAPKMFEGEEEEGMCSVIVMTKTGHRAAMKDMAKMIHGK